MWAIFIALIGGIYLAYKFGSDRATSKQADKKIEQLIPISKAISVEQNMDLTIAEFLQLAQG